MSRHRQIRHRRVSRWDRVRLPLFAASLLTTLTVATVAVFWKDSLFTQGTKPVAAVAATPSTPPPSTASTSAAPASTAPTGSAPPSTPVPAAADPGVPAGSGSGRRVVFDQSAQRVWLVEASGTVDRTYLVSGSKYGNLNPGTYAITSRTRKATSFDLSGTMQYFLRFTRGRNAPIGFHAIPEDNHGRPEQSLAQLGTPRSSGCIRQNVVDAAYLWKWAPNGTKVVVVR